jgi:hypothetical protein
MTREEAEAIYAKTVAASDMRIINLLVDLGVLKLDAPYDATREDVAKRLEHMAIMVWSETVMPTTYSRKIAREGAVEIVDILTRAGFRIVPK